MRAMPRECADEGVSAVSDEAARYASPNTAANGRIDSAPWTPASAYIYCQTQLRDSTVTYPFF
jgi:hypothetical protein